jgi:hypothetical protein
MRLMPPGWRLTAALALGCAVLGGLLVVQWRDRTPVDAVGTAGAAPSRDRAEAPPTLPAGYSPPALATFDEILERPLFAPDRRPPEVPEPAAPPSPPPKPLRARLEGVALVGDARVAVIRDLSTNEGLRLSEGMEFQGWTVDAVEPDRALLKRGDRQVQELKLERK